MALTFGGNYQDGLLAEADFGAALLSMSGYEKSSIPNLNGMFGQQFKRDLDCMSFGVV